MAHAWKSLKHKASPEKRAAVKREALAELDRIGFSKLRQARHQTQVAVAEKLGIPQGSVSRMERQQDILLSTLGEYVKALGGRLEMRVVFPEASFELEPLSEKKSA
jgi:hypothetical protein